MRLLHYIEIENFKTFGDKQRIDLDHPAVIIGPNNCGKTSVIQALALWSQAVKMWYEVRRESSAKERTATPLNRLNIVSVPVQRTRFFWHETKVRTGNKDIPLLITVGVEYKGRVEPLPMRFRNQGEDLVYCTPDNGVRDNMAFIEHAAMINVELLYPMSGLETEEPLLQPGRIGVLLGQGQTAQVLRNLCLMVHQESPHDWEDIVRLMKRLFQVELGTAKQNTRGAINLTYQQQGVKEPLDISAAGRGFQQMLLVFAYLFSHQKSVLLIDEPDAHLEMLRQKQVFVLLRDIASRNGSQVVMVTHSEIILDEALDTNLTLLLEGRADNLAKKADIRQSLKVFGAEHYVRARERGYVLYVEGGTDVAILRALAAILEHPVAEVWDERINTFYVENNYPEVSLESELERVEGGFGISPKDHFNGLRKLLPGLKGLAILDNDGRKREDSSDGHLTIRYWKRYETENYFITPNLLRLFVEKERRRNPLSTPTAEVVDEVLDGLILEQVFGGNPRDFDTWKQSPPDAARLIWETKTQYAKLSAFAEEFFRRLAQRSGLTVLLTKGEFHLLVDLDLVDIGTIPQEEVREKLDLLDGLFRNAQEIVEPNGKSEAVDEQAEAKA
ncbi:MAG: AAA family ATPase [Chloroflexi bacterium]|nr:AAA family ATPase [Chloroflexota bacterium]